MTSRDPRAGTALEAVCRQWCPTTLLRGGDGFRLQLRLSVIRGVLAGLSPQGLGSPAAAPGPGC